MQTHSNGWEAWVAELADGIFVSWACPADESAASVSIEDCFDHASAAASFELKERTGHAACEVACGPWAERDRLYSQDECIPAENH